MAWTLAFGLGVAKRPHGLGFLAMVPIRFPIDWLATWTNDIVAGFLNSIVPGPFDFAGRFGPPNETVAPEHLAVCIGYGDDSRPEFGSYVVYPSSDRRGPSRSYTVIDVG